MSFADRTAGRTVTAFFDSRAAARQAVDDLDAAGIPKSSVHLVEGGPEPVEAEAQPSRDKGFWATLTDLFLPEEDRHSYGEGLRRGGFLLAIRADAGTHDRIVEILDREGAIDMSEREAAWELEGWQPARAGRDLAANQTLAADRTPAGSATSATDRSLGGDDAAWIGDAKPIAPRAATDLGASVPTDELREAYGGEPGMPAGIEAEAPPADELAPGRRGVRDRNLGRARVRSYLDEGL